MINKMKNAMMFNDEKGKAYMLEINLIQQLIIAQLGKIKQLNFELGCEEAKLAVFINKKIKLLNKLSMTFNNEAYK